MSQSSNASKSPFSKPSAAHSDIHLYERVRLQSFQGLLRGAQNRMRSTPGRCPRVLLEDLLKAEVISLQLVLAIEDVVKFVKQNFGSENQNPGKEADRCEWRTDFADDGLLRRNFQNAFAQSANALVELTKLRISSDNVCKENMEIPGNTSCSKQEFNDSLETPFFDCAGPSKQSPALENSNITKRLSYGSEKTTFSEPSWSFSVRVSEFSTAPSDITDIAEGTECEDKDNVNIEDMAKDAVKTLRNEMEGLQIKHEKQFVNYTAECLDLSQDENQNMREILKKIMENLTPQDQNWAYQGKFDEHGMEQLFYFILLQKTLKSCLAIIDTVNMDEKESMEDKVHSSKTQELAETNPASTLHPTSHHSNQMLQYPSHHMYQTSPCKRNPESAFNENFLSTTHPAQEIACTAYVELSDDTKDSYDDNCVKKHTAQMNGKRINEFEDEQETKKQRKGIFSCFNTRWPKKRQKRAKKKDCNI